MMLRIFSRAYCHSYIFLYKIFIQIFVLLLSYKGLLYFLYSCKIIFIYLFILVQVIC